MEIRNFFVLISIIFLSSCGSKDDSINIPVEVDFCVDYNFIKSGAMRGIENDLYDSFYEKNIKTKKITPQQYQLTFKSLDRNDSILVNGSWGKKQFFKLLEGKYKVKGYSRSVYCEDKTFENSDSHFIMSDTTMLYFDEIIEITSSQKEYSLNAKYDCYLIIFDNSDINSLYLGYKERGAYIRYKITADKLDDVYYSFINQNNFNKVISEIKPLYPEIDELYCIRKDKSKSIIYLNTFNFIHGNYYYFRDINGEFDIPKMIKAK